MRARMSVWCDIRLVLQRCVCVPLQMLSVVSTGRARRHRSKRGCGRRPPLGERL